MSANELREVHFFAYDLFANENIYKLKTYTHHRKSTVFDHSLHVASMSLKFAKLLPIKIDKRSLVRGAMLHDYFLYDWHMPHHGLHGFTHPKVAYINAVNDFNVNKIEKDIIKKHMFPLTPFPPTKRESIIVCIADKVCAVNEYFKRK